VNQVTITGDAITKLSRSFKYYIETAQHSISLYSQIFLSP